MIEAWLIRPRPARVLLAIGLAIGIAHTLTFLPLDMVSGSGAIWEFPRGIVGGDDFAQVLEGYLRFQSDGWHWPLLLMPGVMPPSGTNLFWLDPVPSVCLVGKVFYSVTGLKFNFLGPYLMACFALPGAAMAAVLVAFGQRSLLATLAGATLAVALPFHLAEWGHPPLCGQYVLLLALALYGASVRARPLHRIGVWWSGLLALTLLSNVYMFVMVGTIWGVTLVRRAGDGAKPRHLVIEATASITAIVAIMVISGMLSSDLRSVAIGGFGQFSLNLGSPFVPQRSGVIAPLTTYRIGMSSQVYGYLGIGVLFALLVSALTSAAWWWRTGWRHALLIAVLLGFFMFALSYRVTLGSHVLLQLPLSDSMVLALSTFRASGRFFWPVGYALVTLAVITVATRLRPAVATLILLTACVLQLIDISPLRTAIARSAVAPPAPIIDRHQAAALAADVGALALFPSFGCVPVADPPTSAEIYREDLLHHLAMEFQLIAARRNLTINSVYNARLRTDCVAEAIIRREPLRASILYVYLDGALPDAAQFGGADPAKICQALGSIRACKLTNDHDGVIR